LTCAVDRPSKAAPNDLIVGREIYS